MNSETSPRQRKQHNTHLASLLIHFHPQTAEEREVKRDGFYRQETTYNKSTSVNSTVSSFTHYITKNISHMYA